MKPDIVVFFVTTVKDHTSNKDWITSVFGQTNIMGSIFRIEK